MCPICGSSTSYLLAYSVVAPWILELVAHESEGYLESEYRRCQDCSLEFFTYRYSEKEMNALYSIYRSDVYFKVRHKWEPWYTRSSMNSFDPEVNLAGVNNRKNFMQDFLELNRVKLAELENVLDFGGDLGQFFPEQVSGKKYLFDPSGDSTKSSDISRVKNLSVIKGQIGLVMNCHTLEHLTFPKETVSQLGELLSPKGVLYIEVPFDKFRTSRFHRTNLYKAYLKGMSKYRFIFTLVDFFTGIYRLKFKRIAPLGIVKQSEHINYFSRESLEKLVSLPTLNYLGISEPDLKFGQGIFKLGRIALVAESSSRKPT